MKQSETRKVQQVGGSTLTVSLPKEWTEDIGLTAGDEVTFEWTQDGPLTVSGNGEKDTLPTSCIIDADSCEQDGMLTRMIVGAYILGYESLEIVADEGLTREETNDIHRVMRRLNGVSIVSEEPEKVVIHNFMDVSKSSIYVVMRRLYTTVLHMLDSAVYGLMQDRPDLIEEVGEMEDEVDVLYWLILRQLLSSVENREMLEEIGLGSPLHIVGNRTAIKSLEGVADCVEDISEQADTVLSGEYTFTPEEKESVSELTKFVHDQLKHAVEALIEQDAVQANQVIEHESAFADKQSTFLDHVADTDDTTVLLAFNKIAWNLERINGYACTIAEITINRSMEYDVGTTDHRSID